MSFRLTKKKFIIIIIILRRLNVTVIISQYFPHSRLIRSFLNRKIKKTIRRIFLNFLFFAIILNFSTGFFLHVRVNACTHVLTEKRLKNLHACDKRGNNNPSDKKKKTVLCILCRVFKKSLS